MNVKWFLFSFSGRINRQPFWAFALCAGLIWLILSLLLGVDILHRSKDAKSIIPTLILLWPSLAVQAKRWHDRDKSAWWLLINIIPIVGPIWAIIENGCLAGTQGENRFGEDPLSGSSKEPLPGKAMSQDNAVPPVEWKAGKYYLSSSFKALVVISAVLAVILSLLFVVTGKLVSAGFLGVLPFAVMDTLIIAITVWRMRTPVVELSETGIKVGVPFVFKTNTAKWAEIEGMVIGEISTLGYKEKTIKLLLKAEGAATKEMQVSLKAVEKPDEIIARLRLKIPEKRYEDVRQAAVLQRPITKKEVRYRGWVLTQTGLTKGKETIQWNSVKELKYAGLVIAGYGATTISYTSYAGRGVTTKTVNVQPSSKDEYLDFIRYLIQYSSRAAIDPGLVKALEYPPKDARADSMSILLFLSGIIFFFVSLTIIIYYSPSVKASNIHPLIIVPFGLIPMIMSVKALAGRFRGKVEPSSRKLLWTGLINAGLLCSLIIYFALSPYSFNWMTGDIYRKLHNLEQTERYYRAALGNIPDGLDVLYELGTVYMEKKDYERAFTQLKRAYERDPKYWGPDAVVLIPDALMKLGRYDEALKWCERILRDQPDMKSIAKAIDIKKDEIENQRKISEQDQSNL